ncbi:STAS domain-containing protein [Mycobacterium aquaticum]|uniref:STAS domain-containing protein n=1 Tax=Mycobacterium aquaticum TaxID=1927124 RepID=A0A1X0BC60_9MYCO|nr:STAS domain-containing protein [Mycobacterium aquaticum]ORA39910.1 STAS domain-containing protein [Mycobacterium aquaticum]
MTYTGPKLTRISTCAPALGVRLCSYPRPPAVVIEVGGEIDARSVRHVSHYLIRFVHVGRPLVLDCSGVGFINFAGFRAILRFATECRQSGRDWVLVASDAVKLLLPTATGFGLPVAETLDEAVLRLAETPDATWRLRSVTTLECKKLAGD